MKLGKILVTCGWPYVNYLPHLGTLIQVLSADVVARYYRLKGEEVVMVSGSDEHGTPIEVEALRLNVTPKQLTDKNHEKVKKLFRRWDFSFDNYTRTENPIHKQFVQQHLMDIYNNGYIFTEETEMPYCEKCRRFLPDRFVEGECPHCGYEIARGGQCDSCGRLLEPKLLINPYCTICESNPVIKKTKHWYLDLPSLSEELINYLDNNQQLSKKTRNFSLNMIKEGLKPRAVTRDVEWGIPAPFPGAEEKSLYVWIEAVLGYISATIQYFKNQGKPEKWKEYWFNDQAKTLFFVGKDNVPFHTIIFPALLLASQEDYQLPRNVSATEFLQFEGEAFSKSRKIGIWIDEALEMFPADYWRYFLIAIRPETKDTNFSWELFIEKINSDLNNTLGNFIHRTSTFLNTYFHGEVPSPGQLDEDAQKALDALQNKVEKIEQKIEENRLRSAAHHMIGISRMGNKFLNEEKPWEVVKTDKEQAAQTLYVVAQIVKALAVVSSPFIPSAAEELWTTLRMSGDVSEQSWTEALNPLPAGHKIGDAEPLFQKVEVDSQELRERLEKIRRSS